MITEKDIIELWESASKKIERLEQEKKLLLSVAGILKIALESERKKHKK